MDIIGGLAAASQALEIAKVLRSVGRDYDAVALKGEIIDLMDKLLDMKAALQDARQSLEGKDAMIVQLRQAAQVKEATILRYGMSYRASAKHPGEPQGRPFCKRCEEIDSLMVTTTDNGMTVKCPQCKTEYRHVGQYEWDDEAK